MRKFNVHLLAPKPQIHHHCHGIGEQTNELPMKCFWCEKESFCLLPVGGSAGYDGCRGRPASASGIHRAGFAEQWTINRCCCFILTMLSLAAVSMMQPVAMWVLSVHTEAFFLDVTKQHKLWNGKEVKYGSLDIRLFHTREGHRIPPPFLEISRLQT